MRDLFNNLAALPVPAAKVKYNFNSDEEDEQGGSSDEELFDNDAVKEADHHVEVDSDLDTSAVQPPPPAKSVPWGGVRAGRGWRQRGGSRYRETDCEMFSGSTEMRATDETGLSGSGSFVLRCW